MYDSCLPDVGIAVGNFQWKTWAGRLWYSVWWAVSETDLSTLCDTGGGLEEDEEEDAHPGLCQVVSSLFSASAVQWEV